MLNIKIVSVWLSYRQLWVIKCKGKKCITATCSLTGTTSAECLCVPEALVVESSLVGHPGGVPAGVLLLIRAADLIPQHRSRLEAQRSVVRTFCGQRQMQQCFNVSSELLRPLRSSRGFCTQQVFPTVRHTLNQPPQFSWAGGLTVRNWTLHNDSLREEHKGSDVHRSTQYTGVSTGPILGSLIWSSHLCRR